MSNECRCTNPDGGGTKCPPQHIALCIRGKDKECYGDCTPIPNSYSFQSGQFKEWLNTSIFNAVYEYALVNYRNQLEYTRMSKSREINEEQGGRIVFTIGSEIIHVRFSYEFSKDRLGGSQLYR